MSTEQWGGVAGPDIRYAPHEQKVDVRGIAEEVVTSSEVLRPKRERNGGMIEELQYEGQFAQIPIELLGEAPAASSERLDMPLTGTLRGERSGEILADTYWYVKVGDRVLPKMREIRFPDGTVQWITAEYDQDGRIIRCQNEVQKGGRRASLNDRTVTRTEKWGAKEVVVTDVELDAVGRVWRDEYTWIEGHSEAAIHVRREWDPKSYGADRPTTLVGLDLETWPWKEAGGSSWSGTTSFAKLPPFQPLLAKPLPEEAGSGRCSRVGMDTRLVMAAYPGEIEDGATGTEDAA